MSRYRRWARPCNLLSILPLLWLGQATVSAAAPAAPGPSNQPLWGISAALYGKTTLPGGHFTYALTSGSTAHDAVILHNYQARPQPLALYATDLITAQGGGLAPIQPNQPSHGVGRWTRLGRADVTVPPHGQVQVPFTVAPPRGTIPGDYYGAVVAAAGGARGAGVQIVTRAALIVHVRIQGVAHLGLVLGALRSVSAKDGLDFSLSVRNTGNVTVTLDGSVLVRGGGHLAARLALAPRAVYVIPGGTTDLHTVWRSAPLIGRDTAVAELTARTDSSLASTYTSQSLAFTFFPWRLAGGLAAALGLSGMGLYRGRHLLARLWRDWREDRALLAQARATRRARRLEPGATETPGTGLEDCDA